MISVNCSLRILYKIKSVVLFEQANFFGNPVTPFLGTVVFIFTYLKVTWQYVSLYLQIHLLNSSYTSNAMKYQQLTDFFS